MPEEAAAASATAPAPELAEEAPLGGTPAGRAANAALRAISRTARSFQLYDPHNEAIRGFLEDLRTKMEEALRAAGPLAFEVRPFELVLAGEVVYLERDRERSLAFRMYRDGVRRLTVHREIEWDEILRLLEVLAVRYLGVRQDEDDVVTLLRKAGLQHVELVAVEGFVPEQDDALPGAHPGARSPVRAEVPHDWDLPARTLEEAAEGAAREVPEAEQERLRAEEASEALPANAVRAVVTLLEAVADEADPTSFDDVAGFVGEVRDFLLADGQLAQLTALVRALGDEAKLPAAQAAPVLATFADKKAIGRILRSVPKGTETAPAELVALLDLLPADHLTHLIDLLGEERSEASRRCARSLIERYAPKRPEELVSRLRSAEPAVARDLLRVCAHALPDRAIETAREMALHPDDGVVLEALWILSAAPPSPAVGRSLVRMLDSASVEIRLRVVDTLVKRKEHAAFTPLARHVERRAHLGMPTREAEAYGQALARLSPDEALTLFDDWTHPRRLVERLVPSAHAQLLRWAAVAGLGALPGDKADKLIRRVAEQGDEELQRHCQAALQRRETRRG